MAAGVSCSSCRRYRRSRNARTKNIPRDHLNRAIRDSDGRAKLHADIAHPINSTCREYIQSAIIKAFQEERERSKQPGYVCRYDDYDAEYEAESYTAIVTEMAAARKAPEGYRTDAAHGQRPAHAPATQQTSETVQQSKRDFGSGIL